MSERFRVAHKNAWNSQERQQWIFGTMGKKRNDGGYDFDVPGKAGFVYVTLRVANGAQTNVPARNDAGVPQGPKTSIRMKLEYGVYVIYGRSGDQATGTINQPVPPSGVPSHSHTTGDEQTILEDTNRFAITDNGVSKYVLWSTIREEIQDQAASIIIDTDTVIWTYDDDLNVLSAEIQDAGRLSGNNVWSGNNEFNPIVNNGPSFRVTRNLSSVDTDNPVVNLRQTNAGDDQATLRVQQSGTGDIVQIFDGLVQVVVVEDGGQVGFGATPTATVHIKETQTAGEALRVERDLGSASTDSPLVNLIQDNTGDDQIVLRVQQDGTGNIVEFYDGAVLVFSIADGGSLVGTGSATFTGELTSNTGVKALAASPYFLLFNSVANQGYFRFVQAGAVHYLQSGLTNSAGSTADLYFSDVFASNIWMAIKANGSVGIGTSIGATVAQLDLVQLLTTGNGLRVYRNLTATSTDSPLVSFIQDHSGDDQTAVRIQQDGTGAILVLFDDTTPVFRVIDGGQTGIGILPTATLHVSEAQTTGEALRVIRDLASASTDSPLVNFIQDNSGDDQIALRVQQDGTGDILALFGGATQVFWVQSSGFVGVGIAPTTQLSVKAGASSNDAAVEGGLYVDSGTHANTTTGETDLATYTVPADTLNVNNMELYFEAWGSYVNNGNTKTVKVKFGSDSFTVFNGLGSAFDFHIVGRIVRTGATTQKVFIQGDDEVATVPIIIVSTATRTLSGSNILKLTGQGGATNDIKQEYFKVWWGNAIT